jgi:hypothetical protein
MPELDYAVAMSLHLDQGRERRSSSRAHRATQDTTPS